MRWVTKRLATETSETVADVQVSVREALTAALWALRQVGDVREDITRESTMSMVAGLVKSGYFNLNPAIVRISAISLTEDVTRVTVFATAKEGLIKQRTAQGAVERVQSFLLTALA